MPPRTVAAPAAPAARKASMVAQANTGDATPPKAAAVNKRKASTISTPPPQPLTRKFPTFGRRANGAPMSASSSVASASPSSSVAGSRAVSPESRAASPDSRGDSRSATPPPQPIDLVATGMASAGPSPAASPKGAPQTPTSKIRQQQAAATKVQSLLRQKRARNEVARRSQRREQGPEGRNQETSKRADLAATRVQAIARRKRAQKEVARLSQRRSGAGGESDEPLPQIVQTRVPAVVSPPDAEAAPPPAKDVQPGGGGRAKGAPAATAAGRGAGGQRGSACTKPVAALAQSQPSKQRAQSAFVAPNGVSALPLAGVGGGKAVKGGRGASKSPPPSRPATPKLGKKDAAAKGRSAAPLKARPGGSPAPSPQASPARSRPQTPKASPKGRGKAAAARATRYGEMTAGVSPQASPKASPARSGPSTPVAADMLRRDLLADMKANMSRIVDVFFQIDKDRGNSIDRVEFSNAIFNHFGGKYSKLTLGSVFDSIDKDGAAHRAISNLVASLIKVASPMKRCSHTLGAITMPAVGVV